MIGCPPTVRNAVASVEKKGNVNNQNRKRYSTFLQHRKIPARHTRPKEIFARPSAMRLPIQSAIKIIIRPRGKVPSLKDSNLLFIFFLPRAMMFLAEGLNAIYFFKNTHAVAEPIKDVKAKSKFGLAIPLSRTN